VHCGRVWIDFFLLNGRELAKLNKHIKIESITIALQTVHAAAVPPSTTRRLHYAQFHCVAEHQAPAEAHS
jgi:hypothetical protein